jgi:diaminohydroxyphosphoribosylaminopyrimidine deaminase/5-amino-6-(5-phosphoribosylamino)uracil reductase
LVNKVTFFIAPIIIGSHDAPSAIGGGGVERVAEASQLEHVRVNQHGRDVEITGYPKRRDEG